MSSLHPRIAPYLTQLLNREQVQDYRLLPYAKSKPIYIAIPMLLLQCNTARMTVLSKTIDFNPAGNPTVRNY